MLVGLLAMTIGIGGTIAYYSKVFTSNDNLIRATIFDVGSDGTLDGDAQFDLTGQPLSPGAERDIYEFRINKNNTETALKYELLVEGLGELFEDVGGNKSPVGLKLFRQAGKEWAEVDLDMEITDPDPVENFRIGVKWDHQDDYDIDYQGKVGKVNIKLVAKQVEEAGEPVEPIEPRTILEYYFDYPYYELKLNSEDLEIHLPGAHKFRLQTFKANGDLDYQSLWRNINDQRVLILPSNMKVNENTRFVVEIGDNRERVLKVIHDVPVVEVEQ